MSSGAIHTGRRCGRCGEEIVVDNAAAAKLRAYCTKCKPSARVRKKELERKAKPSKKTAGQPFTVDHFQAWAEKLKLDSGELYQLEVYQANYLADLFAPGDAAKWLYNEAWLVVPEGNGKSTFVSLVSLYHIEHTPFGFVPVAASSRDQAWIIYGQAEGFVKRNRMGQFKCNPGYRKISCPANEAVIQIYAADANTGDGVIPTLAWVDELHRHRDLDLYRTWSGKLEKRSGQVGVISTAGEPGGEFEETRELIRQSADEVTSSKSGCYGRYASPNEGMVMHEFAVPEDGDVEDLELVKLANPFSGITVESLRRKRNKPTMTLNHWNRLTCNLPTRSDSAAITEAEWSGATVALRPPEREPVWLGIDVAWKWDTTALVPLWMPTRETRLLCDPIIIEPPRDGTSLDTNKIKDGVLEINRRNPIHTVVMDTSRAEDIAEWIATEIGCTVVDRGQSNLFMVNDYDRFMEGLRGGQLKHTGDPTLKTHVLNAVARALPGGDTRFDRPTKSRRAPHLDTRVIDGLTAAAMVHSTAVADFREPPPKNSSWRPL